MARKLQIKRGANADLPILSPGEFGFSTDAGVEKLHIGNGAGTKNVQIPTVGVYYGDMSELVSSGIYRVGTNDGLPEGLWYGQVLVMQGADSDTVCQIGMGYTDGKIYARSGQKLESGVYQWRTWGSPPNADDMVAKAGDTMTGVLNISNPNDYVGMQKFRSINDELFNFVFGIGSDTTRGASGSLRLTNASGAVKGRIDAWENGELTYNAAGLGYIPIGRIITGTYTGAGKSLSTNHVSLTFSSEPKALFIVPSGNNNNNGGLFLNIIGNKVQSGYINRTAPVTVVREGNTIGWYAGSDSYAANVMDGAGTTYYYVAII